MWTFVGIRWAALVAFIVLALQAVPTPWRFRVTELPELARVGGWMTVSVVVASVMLYADRFAIGALVSIAAVAYYAAPFEIINRLSVIPAAVMGVVFPAFSQLVGSGGSGVLALYRRSLATIAVLLAPPVIVIGVWSEPLLTVWLGAEAAERSAVVASILAVGALVHGLIQPSFHLLQAAGRPDVPAVFQLVEAPFFIGYLIALTLRFGIEGTAAAWLIRVVLSLIVQSWLVHRFVLSDVARREVTA
jgi:O-antigen/teichoic acid export membrane protein